MVTHTRTYAAAALAALVVPLAGCGADDEPSVPEGRRNAPAESTRTAGADDTAAGTATGEVSTEDVATGLTSPWGVVELSGGDLLVSERDTGRIVRVDPADGSTTEVRILPDVVPGGEAGLLGLAMTPDEDRLLAYYTLEGSSRVVSMAWDGRSLGEPQVVLDGIPGGAGYHQGGRLLVGHDDLLYVGTGDNGDPASAQDPQSLSGKVLRVTLEGAPAPGNPFDNEVWTLGHRNVEGLAVDDRGRVWSAEFGDSAWDELNLLEGGSNYGWPEVEGSGGGEDLVDPVAVWRPEDASPSGLAVWDGSLWLAALRGARLWEVPLQDGGGDGGEDGGGDGGGALVGAPVSHLGDGLGRLRTVLPLSDGSMLLTTSNTDGRGEPRDGDDRLLRVTR